MPAVSSVDEVRTAFASHRYVKLPGLLDGGLCRMLYDHAKRRGGVAIPSQLEGAAEVSSDELMEFLLAGIHPRIEELSGLKLHPTYSFLRIYRRGSSLVRHTDRPACEVSVSINLGPSLPAPWPLWIQGPLGASGIDMQPGDGVLYRGIECEHWREPLEADELTQVFLHFVEQDGRYAEWKFDKRRRLGI